MDRLHISPEAKDDLAKIKGYISQELNNPQAAEILISVIMKKISRLPEHPEQGMPVTQVVDFQTNYRFFVCAKYLIFYKHADDILSVSRILYGRRDYALTLFGDLPEVHDK